MSDTKAFFDAIRAGDLARVTSLVDADPSLVSAKNESGATAILAATYTGRYEIRDLLVQRSTNLEIHDTAAAGKIERVRELVNANPSLAKSYSPDGFPVFALACFFGHFDVARYLAEKGADVNAAATNGTGYNAITAAVAAGHTEIVKWLVANGANVNYRYGPGYSPLLTAAADDRLEIVKLLLAHGADPSAITDGGKSALALATERKHTTVANFLRQNSTR
jgi:uncharacterized protein